MSNVPVALHACSPDRDWTPARRRWSSTGGDWAGARSAEIGSWMSSSAAAYAVMVAHGSRHTASGAV
jgi:hypothetical protein